MIRLGNCCVDQGVSRVEGKADTFHRTTSSNPMLNRLTPAPVSLLHHQARTPTCHPRPIQRPWRAFWCTEAAIRLPSSEPAYTAARQRLYSTLPTVHYRLRRRLKISMQSCCKTRRDQPKSPLAKRASRLLPSSNHLTLIVLALPRVLDIQNHVRLEVENAKFPTTSLRMPCQHPPGCSALRSMPPHPHPHPHHHLASPITKQSPRPDAHEGCARASTMPCPNSTQRCANRIRATWSLHPPRIVLTPPSPPQLAEWSEAPEI